MIDMTYYPILRTDELTNGERVFIEINGNPIVIFNIAGGFFAISDECTHDDGPLGDGDLDGYQIICPRHGARFDVRTGEALALPAVLPTKSYPIRVTEGMIEIGLE